jgi:glycerol kinase
MKVDGGMTANALLMQSQADILGVPVIRSEVRETTALGAAYAAGLAVGYWRDFDDLRSKWRSDARWEAKIGEEERERAIGGWRKAVERAMGWEG